jgi:hypothetical protein
MAKQPTPDFSRIVSSADYPSAQSEFIHPTFIQYKVGAPIGQALAMLWDIDGVLIEFPIYGQAYKDIHQHFSIEVEKEESTYHIIKLVKK